MSKSFKDISRQLWNPGEREIIANEDIQTGCLQRIADATELMAKSYRNLVEENEKFYKWYKSEKAEKERLQRSIIAHKANFTRLKNKLEAKTQNGEFGE